MGKFDGDVRITEIDSDDEAEVSYVAGESSAGSSAPQIPIQAAQALAQYDPDLSERIQLRRESPFQQKRKETDDSDRAYANNYVQERGFYVGSVTYAPIPEPSAPPMPPEEQKKYEAWLNASQLSIRKNFSQHETWQAGLKQLGHEKTSPPLITRENIPNSETSTNFKQRVAAYTEGEQRNSEKLESFLGRTVIPGDFDDFQIYVPDTFNTGHPEADLQHWMGEHERVGAAFDELLVLCERTNGDERVNAGSLSMPRTIRVPPGRFIVLSNHGGRATGTNLYILGSGIKQPLTMLSAHFRHNLGFVNGCNGEQGFNFDTDYLALLSLTVIRIEHNEIGFCHDRYNGVFKKMLPGRYVLLRGFNFVGKAVVNYHDAQPTPLATLSERRGEAFNPENQAFRDDWAQDVSVLYVPPRHVAFIASPKGSFVLQHRQDPYLVNRRKGYEFRGSVTLDQFICSASDDSYRIVTLRQPGEYVIFKDEVDTIVWEYQPDNPAWNTLHLSNAFFAYDGKIYDNRSVAVTVDNLTVLSKPPQQTIVLEDGQRNIRFLEHASNEFIIVQQPWRYIASIATSDPNYTYGEPGSRVSRVRPTDVEWVVVQNRQGQFQLFPPLLDGSPYYFYEPEFTFIGVANKNKEGEQVFNIPGVGSVSIVNLTTGNIGSCLMNNTYFLLNPLPIPYVLLSPNKYLGTIPRDQSYARVGDIHRICLQPNERCVVSQNGKTIALPFPNNHPDWGESNAEDGVYIFRSSQFRIFGPVNISEQESKLGPLHYINVSVGSVGFGTVNGELHVWPPGKHCIYTEQNQEFEGFFSTEVDTINITGFEITSKHSITSLIDFSVSFRVQRPETAITHFKSKEALENFVKKTTEAEILKLCASRPPIGYTEADFSPVLTDRGDQEDKEETAQKSVKGIIDSFKVLTQQFTEDYGIRLGEMCINGWKINSEFVEQQKQSALTLLNKRTEAEAQEIELRKQRTENEGQSALIKAQAEQQTLQNNIDQLRLEQAQRKALSEAEIIAGTKAAEQIAQAKAQAAVSEAEAQADTAKARAKADSDLDAKKSIYAAEQAKAASETGIAQERIKKAEAEKTAAIVENQAQMEMLEMKAKVEACAATAPKTAQAKAQVEIARAETETARLEAEKVRLLAEAEANRLSLLGAAEADKVKADVEARYPGATGDALIQLRMCEMLATTQQAVAEKMQIVTHTLSPEDTRQAVQDQLKLVVGAREAFGLNTPCFLPPFVDTTAPMRTGEREIVQNPAGLFARSSTISLTGSDAQQALEARVASS